MVKKGYKQTEVGVVPKEWSVMILRDIADFLGGGTPSKSIAEYWNGDIPWISSSDISLNSVHGLNITRYITGQAVKESSTQLCPRNAILIVTRVGVGKIAIAPTKICTSQDFTNIVLRQDNVEYVARALQPVFHCMSNETQGTSIKGVTTDEVKNTSIALPPIKEQEQIATVLSEIDELISLAEKQISKKKAIKQGAMQELLTGKRRLPGFSGEWSKCKLGSLGVLLKGTGISRNDSNSGNLPAVRYGELYTKHRNYVNSYFSHISKEVASNAQRVYRGDILFAASGETKEDIGKCSAIIYETAAYAGGDILIFRPTAQLDPVFMGTLLNMADARKQRAEQGQGDAVVHIHADALSSISIMIPNIEEQQAIAEILIGMDKEIELLERKLEKYRQVKQGMMQQLLTGNIRLV